MTFKKSFLMLILALILTLSGFALPSPLAHAATAVSTHSASTRLANTGTVPCTPAYNKVGLQKLDGSWVCYGGGVGTANVGFEIKQYHSDSWSGYLIVRGGGKQAFCYGSQHYFGFYIASIQLSDTLVPYCTQAR